MTLKREDSFWLISTLKVVYLFICLNPRYRPTWPRGVQEVKASRFLNTRHPYVPAAFTPSNVLVLIFRG